MKNSEAMEQMLLFLQLMEKKMKAIQLAKTMLNRDDYYKGMEDGLTDFIAQYKHLMDNINLADQKESLNEL